MSNETDIKPDGYDYALVFLDGVMNPGALPLYFALIAVIGWLGYLTTVVIGQHGGDIGSVQEVLRVAKYMMYILISYPVVSGASKVLHKWRGQNND